MEDYIGADHAGFAKAKSGSGQIPQELDRQQSAGVELHDVISALEEKLNPIRLRRPEPESLAERDDPVRTEVTQAIANGTAQISTAAYRLRKLIDEIEL